MRSIKIVSTNEENNGKPIYNVQFKTWYKNLHRVTTEQAKHYFPGLIISYYQGRMHPSVGGTVAASGVNSTEHGALKSRPTSPVSPSSRSGKEIISETLFQSLSPSEYRQCREDLMLIGSY